MADLSPQLDAPTEAPGDAFVSPEALERRRRALEQMTGPKGMDDLDPKGPSGHAYAIATSTRLTSDFRRTYRKAAVDVTPQEVIDVLNEAGAKQWVLMGLHGYIGYMPDPRATQDVYVMVRHSERKRPKRQFPRGGRSSWSERWSRSFGSWIPTIWITKANRSRSSI